MSSHLPNSYVETPSVQQSKPKLTFSVLRKLLDANKDKNVITVGPGDYQPETGEIQNLPNTESGVEDPTEVGHTLDSLQRDKDQKRRRLVNYKIGEEVEQIQEDKHLVSVTLKHFGTGQLKTTNYKVVARTPNDAVAKARNMGSQRGEVIKANYRRKVI